MSPLFPLRVPVVNFSLDWIHWKGERESLQSIPGYQFIYDVPIAWSEISTWSIVFFSLLTAGLTTACCCCCSLLLLRSGISYEMTDRRKRSARFQRRNQSAAGIIFRLMEQILSPSLSSVSLFSFFRSFHLFTHEGWSHRQSSIHSILLLLTLQK